MDMIVAQGGRVTSEGLGPEKPVRPRSSIGLFTSPRNQIFLLGFLLVVATVVLYFPVNSHPFANYDDPDYVTDNFHVRSGLHWSTVKWAFTTYAAANWHPLTWISHAADVQLFELNPGRHHDVNLLLHTLNVVLLFWVLQRARLRCPQRDGGGVVCAASHQCGIRGVDCRAQEPAEHVVFPARPGRLPMVCD